jgi:hypothetical protein
MLVGCIFGRLVSMAFRNLMKLVNGILLLNVIEINFGCILLIGARLFRLDVGVSTTA